MAYQYTFTCYLFGLILCALAVLGILVWLWGTFLDKYEHDPGRIRAVMFLILSVITVIELGFAVNNFTCPWVVSISLLANIWGGLDALLRFPAAHDAESFFAVKQFILLIAKTLAYAFGFVSLKKNMAKFLLHMLLNIWGLPVIYLMALPLDPAEQVVKDDAYDIDLAVRIWQLALCSKERSRCMTACRIWCCKGLAAASECSPLARSVICAANPKCQRAFRITGRSI